MALEMCHFFKTKILVKNKENHNIQNDVLFTKGYIQK